MAHEVYGEDAARLTPDQSAPFQNGLENAEDEKENGGEIAEITRIRLVQFAKNTNEPLVWLNIYCIKLFAVVKKVLKLPRLTKTKQ